VKIENEKSGGTLSRPSVNAVVFNDDQAIRDSKAEQDRQYRTQNSIRKAAWCAFGAAAIYAGIASFQWREMHNATLAAERTALAAQQQFEMSERPWVITKFTPSAPIEWASDGSVSFEILEQTTNTGHSVALHVFNTPIVLPQFLDGKILPTLQGQKEMCERDREVRERTPDRAAGDMLFPGDVAFEKLVVRIRAQDVERAKLPGTNLLTGFMLYGCTEYTFSFSPKDHQTGYVYDIVVPSPKGIGSLNMTIGQPVPANQYIIRRSLLGMGGGFYAD
jgi:hypothetical protein